MQRRFLRIALIAALLFAVAGAAVLLQQPGRAQTEAGRSESLATALEVMALVHVYHVEDVDMFSLVRAYLQKGTINGMLREVLEDDYTRYMDRNAFARMQEDTVQGEFGGIGIVVGVRDGRLTIISPISGTPGFRAGLRGGDWILKVDGYETEFMSQDEAVSMMRGPVGEPVVLTIQRGDEVWDVTIIREKIEVPSVERWTVITPDDVPHLAGPVGYIQLSNFNEKTMPQMNEALDRLLAAGIQGLILDLRNNGGGLLSTALQLADRFIENGPLVHVVSANNQRRTYMAEAEGTFPSMPMVVLVNQYSASASEIVAGALRDNGVAVLVGTQTFGKGSVQTVLPLRGGAGLALTTAHYETAGGHFIHGVGITPDVIVEVPDEMLDTLYLSYDGGVNLDDVQLQKALEVLSDMMRARLSPAA